MTDPSQVTVAPADIRAFAAVLQDLTETLQQLRSSVTVAHNIDFGEYANSHTAADRYHGVVEDRLAGLDRLVTTTERFTDGTSELARNYTDVADLNQAHAQEVTQILGEGTGE